MFDGMNAVKLSEMATTKNEMEVTFVPGVLLSEVEKSVILKTLVALEGNRTHTARVLGIGLRTLQRKIKQYRDENPDLECEILCLAN